MEDILKEMLYELKEVRKEIRVIGGNPNPGDVKVSIGEDIIVEKVIDSINSKKHCAFSQDAFVRS